MLIGNHAAWHIVISIQKMFSHWAEFVLHALVFWKETFFSIMKVDEVDSIWLRAKIPSLSPSQIVS